MRAVIDAAGIDAGVDVHQIDERAQQQQRADQQHGADRRLGADQQLPHPDGAAALRAAASFFLQRVAQVDAQHFDAAAGARRRDRRPAHSSTAAAMTTPSMVNEASSP